METRKFNLLFVCSANVNRSKAFEREVKRLLEAWPPSIIQYNVKSSGCWYGYPDKLDQNLMDWADKILVMDLSHKIFINKNWPNHLYKIRVIGVSDQYDVDDEELKEVIEYWYQTEFLAKDGMI